MANEIRWRRGTTAQHATFTGAVAEVTVDTDKKTVVVHDGVTAGGTPLAKEAEVTAHKNRTDNPHGVTKAQVGLGNVDNTSDALKPISAAVQAALDSMVVASEGPGGAQFGFRNKLINGNFDIWQRGDSQTEPAAYKSVDRWIPSNYGNTFTLARIQLGAGDAMGIEAHNFMRVIVNSVAGTSNFTNVAQRIESVRSCAGKTITVSFLARRVEGAGSMTVELTQHFGDTGTPSAEINGATNTELRQKIALTGNWQKFKLTFSVPSVEGKTITTASSLRLHFWFNAGTAFANRTDTLGQLSGTYDIAQVQLEEGTEATPFELRPVALELALCQRYHEIVALPHYFEGGGVATVTYRDVLFAVAKRTVPTVTTPSLAALTNVLWDSAGGNLSPITFSARAVSLHQCSFQIETAGGAIGGIKSTADTGLTLRFDAEL